MNTNRGCRCDHRHCYGWSGLFQIFDQIPHLGFEPRTSRTLSANSTTGPLASADDDIYLNIILQRCGSIEVSVKAHSGILHLYSLLWLNGLVVWFSLWVREAPGSNPGWALRFCPVFRNFSIFFKFWGNETIREKSPRRDLNSRPLVYKTSALTTELRRRDDQRKIIWQNLQENLAVQFDIFLA